MKIEIHAAQHEKPGRVLNMIREMFAADGWDIFIADPPSVDAIGEAARKLAGKSRPLLIKVYRTTPNGGAQGDGQGHESGGSKMLPASRDWLTAAAPHPN